MKTLSINDSFINARGDEITTIIRMSDKMAYLNAKSCYCTFVIKRSKSNILNLVKTGQWVLIPNNYPSSLLTGAGINQNT